MYRPATSVLTARLQSLDVVQLCLCADNATVCTRDVQEEMYSFVTVADDQTTKGKGVNVVDDA